MKRHFTIGLFFAVLAVGPPAAQQSELHDWTSTGGHKVRASLLRSETVYVLRKEDGTEVPVPAALLSAESQALAEAILARRASATSALEIILGDVVRVVDGDTLVVLDDTKTQHRVRLEGIDCPEAGQDYGTKATKAIAEKVSRKRVRLQWMTKDPYDRVLADVHLGSRWINREMVEEGWAWHYKKYSASQGLAEAETRARAAKAGLWQGKAPIPPWEFRRTPP